MASARKKIQVLRKLLKKIRTNRAAKKQWKSESHPRYSSGKFKPKNGSGLNPSTPRFTAITSAPTESDREQWMEAREQPIPEGTPQILVDRFRDNVAMSRSVLLTTRRDPAGFRGVRDAGGNLQAGATITNERDHIFIDTFATAPWNVFRTSPKSVRDAGKVLLAEIVKESINKGHKGEIRLSSLPGSASFYMRIGLVEDDDSGEMILSSQNAREFLRDVQSFRHKSDSL